MINFEEDIIPRVETMLQKEITHKKHLLKQYNRFKSLNKLFFFYPIDLNDIESYLITSYRMINHFTYRLIEYKQYIKKQ